jgi:8-oxo-dGTP pyrophosphatase MutT (NUDIX family)
LKNVITARYSAFVVLYYVNPRSDGLIYLVTAIKRRVQTSQGSLRGTKRGCIGGKEEDVDNNILEATAAREVWEEAKIRINQKLLKTIWINENTKNQNEDAKIFYTYELSEEEYKKIPSSSEEVFIEKIRLDEFLENPDQTIPQHYVSVLLAVEKVFNDNRSIRLLNDLELPGYIKKIIDNT